MSRLHERLVSWSKVKDRATRDSLYETKTILKLLEDLLGQFPPGGSGGPPTTIINNFGNPSSFMSYPMVVDASSHLFPDGMPIQFLTRVKILRCYMTCDPQIPASAATAFTLQNKPSSPTSTGTVTFANGATFAQSTTLGVVIDAGQKLYIKSPAALNDVQRINNIYLEWQVV